MMCALEKEGWYMDYYELLRGPVAWIAFTICLGGIALRLCLLLARARNVKRLNPGKSIRGGFKSIVRGAIPFSLHYMRENPVFTVVTFLFHLCVVLTPIFLLAHIVLFYESWQVQWASLPDNLADIMSLVVILAVVFFAMRRLVLKPVKRLTRNSDWMLLILVAGVFLTGLMAFHHWGPYRIVLITHLFLGETLLVTIPFSKLIHMLLFFFTRGYLGAEYEIILDSQY